MSYELPPIFRGTTEDQAQQIHSYLYRLVEALNLANDAINEHSIRQITETISKSGGNMPSGDTLEQTKALINATAKDLNNAFLGLSGNVEQLQSNFGQYESSIEQRIEETASGIITNYGFQSAITNLQEQAVGFSEYRIQTEGFIKQGFVTTSDDGVPIVGIAIGQGLTSQKVVIDGNEYEQLDASQSCAFYTADKVSFRVNGQEVAYVSNRKLYIGDVEITGDVVLGGNWFISSVGGALNLKWIGE